MTTKEAAAVEAMCNVDLHGGGNAGLRSLKAMDINRARDISGRLGWAYFVAEGLVRRPMPDLSDVTLVDAIEATRIIRDTPVEEDADGGKTYESVVSEDAIPRVLAAAIAACAADKT